MKTWRKLLGNERGVALPLAMILLLILTMLTITFMSLGSVEPQISRNLSDGARARQLAESGIEWGFNQLAGKVFDHNDLLGSGQVSGGVDCGTSITCKVLVSGQTLPGLTSVAGTFTVVLRNDQVAADQQLLGSGIAADTTSFPDGNKIVILKSTGNFNGAGRTITAVVQRGYLQLNGALNLPGDQADTYTDPPSCSGCYSIDGRDWKDSDTGTNPTLAGVPLKYGVSTNNTGTEADAEGDFDTTAKRNYVRGKNETNPGSSTSVTGYNTFNADNTLTPSMISAFMQNLASNPSTQILNSTQACQYPSSGGIHDKPEGLRMQSTGTPNLVTVTNSGCTGALQIDQTVNLGTAAAPTMLYIKGQEDPSSLFRGLAIDGSNPITGYGILVVDDSDLVFFQSGQFRWNGLVLLTGRNNSAAFLGNSNTEIRGALVVNETNENEPCCFREFFVDTTGTMKIRASQENMDRALLALYNMRISAFRED